MSKYIKYQIKQWLPILAVIFSIFFVTLIVDIYLSSNLFGQYYNENDYIQYKNPLFSTMIAGLLLAIFIPIFSFSYKYSIKKADTYMQLPFNTNKLRITSYLFGYLAIILPFIIMSLIGVSIISITQACKNPYLVYEYIFGVGNFAHIIEYYYNYGYLFLTLFIVILLIFFEYSLSCIAAYHANNTLDSFLYIIFFFIFRLLILYAIPGYFLFHMDIYVNYNVICWNTNVFSEIFLISLILNQLIAYGSYKGNLFTNSYNNDANLQNIGLIVSVILVAILGILAFIYLIFTKDKYKENYGRKRNNTLFDFLLPHLTLLLICFSIYGSNMDMTSSVCVIIAFFIVYYCILAGLNKSFKIKKLDLIYGGCVGLISFSLFVAHCSLMV